MFVGGGGIWGGLAPPPENLLDRERAPPSRPLPVEFPNYRPPPSSEPLSTRRMNQLRHTLAQFRKPSDACDSLFAQFNIHLDTDVPLSDFVPKGQWEQRPFLYDADLTSMLNELSFENEDAYREVLRMPPLEGKTKPRLAYSRNFFASLEDMSRYWDSTKDNYYNAPPGAQRMDNVGDHDMKNAKVNGSAVQPAPAPNTGYDLMADSQLSMSSKHFQSSENYENHTPGSNRSSSFSSPPEREVYKGYRLGNSAQTPPTSRISTVRNLTKMITHKFNCRDFDHGPRERLKIRDVIIPSQMIMYDFNICKVPNDRDLARARYVEGPLMSAYCRHEVLWKQETKDGLLAEGRGRNGIGDVIGEGFDFMREVGGLLILALQRARGEKEGKKDYWAKETEEWWWAKKERWGGGETKWGQLASEVWDDEDPSWNPIERELQLAKRAKEEEDKRKVADVKSDNINVEDLMAGKSEERGDKPVKKRSRIGLPERMRRGSERGAKGKEEKIEYIDGRRVMFVPANKKKWYQDWKGVKPNASPWDDKLIYKGIGREEGDFDDVYQIGCVNHHICLTRMKISRRYLQWLEQGTVDEQEPGVDEEIVKIQKSRWFDLFDIAQRQEFLIGMWRVMCWLNRNEVPQAEYERMESVRQPTREAS